MSIVKAITSADASATITPVRTGVFDISVPATAAELAALAAAIPTAAVADIGALTVGTNIAAFTDPPSAAEMALLRTFVNANKADIATIRTKVNALLAALRTAGIVTP